MKSWVLLDLKYYKDKLVTISIIKLDLNTFGKVNVNLQLTEINSITFCGLYLPRVRLNNGEIQENTELYRKRKVLRIFILLS